MHPPKQSFQNERAYFATDISYVSKMFMKLTLCVNVVKLVFYVADAAAE
jgi:hypothetical protein